MNDSLDPILQQEEQRKLRIQLIWRLGIAVILVVGVLATLTWLDQDRESPPKMTVNTRKATPPAAEIASAPAFEPTTAPPASTEAASAASNTEAEIPDTPVAQPASQTSLKETSPAANPIAPTVPAAIRPALSEISKTAIPTPPAAPRKSSLIQHETVSPYPAHLASIPTTPPISQQASTGIPYPPAVAATHGYTVQTGVFLHSANAEKMLKQMQYAGIPAYLETRVQIGPFRSRMEADAAVRKLRSLGIEPIIKTD